MEMVASLTANAIATQLLAVRELRPRLQERLPGALVQRESLLEEPGVLGLPCGQRPQVGCARLRPRPAALPRLPDEAFAPRRCRVGVAGAHVCLDCVGDVVIKDEPADLR